MKLHLCIFLVVILKSTLIFGQQTISDSVETSTTKDSMSFAVGIFHTRYYSKEGSWHRIGLYGKKIKPEFDQFPDSQKEFDMFRKNGKRATFCFVSTFVFFGVGFGVFINEFNNDDLESLTSLWIMLPAIPLAIATSIFESKSRKRLKKAIIFRNRELGF